MQIAAILLAAGTIAAFVVGIVQGKKLSWPLAAALMTVVLGLAAAVPFALYCYFSYGLLFSWLVCIILPLIYLCIGRYESETAGAPLAYAQQRRHAITYLWSTIGYMVAMWVAGAIFLVETMNWILPYFDDTFKLQFIFCIILLPLLPFFIIQTINDISLILFPSLQAASVGFVVILLIWLAIIGVSFVLSIKGAKAACAALRLSGGKTTAYVILMFLPLILPLSSIIPMGILLGKLHKNKEAPPLSLPAGAPPYQQPWPQQQMQPWPQQPYQQAWPQQPQPWQYQPYQQPRQQ